MESNPLKYRQPPIGNTEQHISVETTAIESGVQSTYEALKDYEIRDSCVGLEGVAHILAHVVLTKCNGDLKDRDDAWHKSVVLSATCKIKEAGSRDVFLAKAPTQRIRDIERYQQLLKDGVDLGKPLYVSGGFLNQLGADVPGCYMYMLDGARRIVAATLNHQTNIDILLLVTEEEYAQSVDNTEVQQRMADLKWFKNYQTIPLVGLKGSRSTNRYDLMDMTMLQDKTVLDFGCNVGQACIAAKMAGAYEVLGIEGQKDTYELAAEIGELTGFDNLQYLNVDFNDFIFDRLIDDELLGEKMVDYSFFFSVYRTKELTDRDRLFRYIIAKTRTGIFFEGHADKDIDTIEYYDWLFGAFGLTNYRFLGHSEGDLRPLFYISK